MTEAERQQIFSVCLGGITECETLSDLERVAGEIRRLKDLSEIPDADWHQVKQVWLFRKREVVEW